MAAITEPVRLAKRLAEMLACSRSDAEQYIAGGWVRVDGLVVEEPQFRVRSETITLDPHASLTPIAPVTILLNKPPGYHTGDGTNPALALITAASRAANDNSGIHLLKKHFTGLTSTTPLETDASGLVVFTQDWHVARKLGDDADNVEHEVIVEVAGELVPHGLKRLNHGLIFNGKPVLPCKVSWQNEVLSMKRIRIGRVPMAQLPVGQWRYLRADERF